MRYKATVLFIVAVMGWVAAYPQQRETTGLAGDWNVLAKDASGTLQYGAWRIAQQGTQLEVVSRWSHIEAIRQGSGTLAENGRILIIGGPSDGWMESFSGMLSADGSEITGTWSRVDGSGSNKGTFTASRARPQSATPAPAAAAAAAYAQSPVAGRAIIEAPGSGGDSRPAAPSPVKEEVVQPPAAVATAVESAPATALPTAPPGAPVRSQPSVSAEAPPDHQEGSSDMAALVNLLSALVEQNQLLARQLADVRNQSPDKDRLIEAQLAKQQRIFKLLERLIHSKVELEQLLDIFRRSPRNP